jgi:hypothetical protein
MGVISDIDVFFIRLMDAVEMWYDKNYMNIDHMKALHLEIVRLNYEPDRFRKTNNLYNERKQFLAEMHELVWETLTFSY